MEIFKNYNNYKVYENDYYDWKYQRELYDAKKKEYLQKNPVSEEEKQNAMKRGKVLLRALDVMDEYSQTRAEDTEVVMEEISSQILGGAMQLGMGAGTILMLIFRKPKPKIDKVKANSMNEIMKEIAIPYGVGIGASILASIPVLAWAAQIQVGASRHGRFEAMEKDLKDPNQFAILDENQEKQVEETIKTIPFDKSMQKQLNKRNLTAFSPFDSFGTIKELLFKNGAYDEKEEEFENKIAANQAKAGQKLTKKDILTAKKDQKLLLNMVEKVDIASQDYAENVELATNTFNFLSAFASIGLGWATGKILNVAKVKNDFAQKALPWLVGGISAMAVSAYMTSLQKQASRVGRFKIKQEMEKDINNFLYVDDEKINAQPDVDVEEEKQPNIFKFLLQAKKDNAEYQKYMKTEAIEEKKRQKALKQITLSEEQLKDAKALQFKTFKTFNRVDDYSQEYSESVEAVGQIVQNPIAIVGTLAGMGLGALVASKKMAKTAKMAKAKNENLSFIDTLNASIPIFIGTLIGAIPTVAFDYVVTKEQKKASRIADMLAIKELDNYKEFVDYENL